MDDLDPIQLLKEKEIDATNHRLEMTAMQEKNRRLKDEIRQLKETNQRLKEKNQRLKEKKQRLKEVNQQLKEEDDNRRWRRREKKHELKIEIRDLKEEIDELKETIQTFEDAEKNRLEELEQNFNNAVTEGDVVEVERLIQIVEVDLDNFLDLAVRHGNPGVVHVLLADRRVNPMAGNSQAIRRAARYRYSEIVSVLARIPGVVTEAIDYYLKTTKRETKRLYKINQLAQMTGAIPRSEADPSISDEDLLVWASAMGSTP